jgi:hypothetical protein
VQAYMKFKGVEEFGEEQGRKLLGQALAFN